MKEDWRGHLLERIENLFTGNRRGSTLYGVGHALAVEEKVHSILAKNPSFFNADNIPSLIGAALLHDIGYARRVKNWTLDWFAHIKVGQRLAQDILSEIPFYRRRHNLIKKTLHLIQHHDDTTYSFPIINNNGRPKLNGEIPRTNNPELSILREADSLVHVMEQSIQEAIDEWIICNLPLNANNTILPPAWLWNESIINNIRLLAKRFVLDAFTKDGKELSLDVYDKLEKQIQKICLENNIVYQAEICHPKERKASSDRISSRYKKLQIISFHGLDEVVKQLYQASLQEDKSINPYKSSKISLEITNLEKITPMALYLMKGRLSETLEFHDALMHKFAFGLWDLPGLLKFRYNSTNVQIIAPPLIEVYNENHLGPNSIIWGLVDGLHRIRLAQNLDYNRSWVMIVKDVQYPLVPLPVSWNEIVEYEETPKNDNQKRLYRYIKWDDVPVEIKRKFSINEKNFKYFFYRDLRPIGSQGKRGFDEFKS